MTVIWRAGREYPCYNRFGMDILKSLQELGLNKNESLVYRELLKTGLTTAGPLVKTSKLHRQLVYLALERLQGMGLVTVLEKQRRKHFQASSPENLIKNIDRDRAVAEKLVPELQALQFLSKDRLEVKVLYGRKAFMESIYDVVESAERTDKVMRIVGGANSADVYRIVGDDYYSDYLAFYKKHRISKFLIAPENFSDAFREKFVNEPRAILKTLKTGLTSPTYTHMTPEMVMISVFGEEPVVIQIHNKAIARAHLDHFEILWNQAKPFLKE